MALGYIGYLMQRGTGSFTTSDPRTMGYTLLLGGLVTTVPLVCSAAALALRDDDARIPAVLGPDARSGGGRVPFDEPVLRRVSTVVPADRHRRGACGDLTPC